MSILIVDDEPLARERLQALLADLGTAAIAAVGTGPEALARCAAGDIDTVLLDISMPGMDGLEVARHLANVDHPPAVVFCTAHDQYALAAFEAAAVDYLVKPVRVERLAAALQRAAQRQATPLPQQLTAGKQRGHLSARLRGSLRLIPVADIHYLQADEKYVVVHHVRGEDLIEESLKSLETEFGERFVRIHRNCLVARDQLVELRRSADGHVHAVLRDVRESLEVSRRCLPVLRERLILR